LDLNEEIKNFNFLLRLAKQKFLSHKSMTDFTDEDIDALVNDPDIRLCISGLVAIDNFNRALIGGLTSLYQHLDDRVIMNQLYAEITRCDPNADMNELMMMKDKMPYLHAVYLESLRFNSPMPFIPRYTKAGIQTAVLSVPPRSMVVFCLQDMLRQCASEKYSGHEFKPERFLNEYGELNEEAKLNEGFLTPFGLGARHCPAVAVTEAVLKYHLVAFAKHVQHLSMYKFERRHAVTISAPEPFTPPSPCVQTQTTSPLILRKNYFFSKSAVETVNTETDQQVATGIKRSIAQ
jgi:hypothetical protein